MKRLALVIGNSQYIHSQPLVNPKNDANDIAIALKELGFEVHKFLDLKQYEMIEKVTEFIKTLKDYSVGLFYFAGHGMQIKGKNYLVPVDCNITTEEETALSCYEIDNLLNSISIYKDKTNIIILDSCRTNPFSDRLRGTMSSYFTEFSNPPLGTIISFSTSPDKPASDGQFSNGLFTGVLKEYIRIPNIKIEELFKMVRAKVSKLSGNKQIPWEHSCLVGDFYFCVKELSHNNITNKDIYDFINNRFKYYDTQDNLSIYDKECLPYVEAYQKFNIPIIEISRAYSKIVYEEQGIKFSDNDIDELNIGYLASWGFKYENYRWYYKNNYVKMGDPLPISEELKKLEPIAGQNIDVNFEIVAQVLNNLVYFNVKTNLPNETPVIFTLSSRNGSYTAQCSSVVKNSKIVSEGFSNKGQLIDDGIYIISISSPIYEVQPDSIKPLLGKRNRNLTGKYIKYSPIGGNTVDCNKILVKDKNELLIF